MSPIFRLLRHRLLKGGASWPSIIGRLRSKALSSRHLSAHVANADQDEDLPEIDHRRLPADYDPADFDPTEHRSPPTPHLFRLVDEVAGLTLLEVADLSLIILRKLGMSEDQLPAITLMKPGSTRPSVTGPGLGPGAGPTTAELKKEKTVFEVKLEAYEAASKIKVIKEVRGFTSLGLKEAKDLVEKAPVVVKGGVSKQEAEIIAEKMKEAGAKVVIE